MTFKPGDVVRISGLPDPDDSWEGAVVRIVEVTEFADRPAFEVEALHPVDIFGSADSYDNWEQYGKGIVFANEIEFIEEVA